MRDKYREYDCDCGRGLRDDDIPIRKQKRAKRWDKRQRIKRVKPDYLSGFLLFN